MLSDILLYLKHYISWYSILKSIPKEIYKIFNEYISEPYILRNSVPFYVVQKE